MNTSGFVEKIRVEHTHAFATSVRQSQKQFGGKIQRDASASAADTFVGKLAELAVQKFLQVNFDLAFALDFRLLDIDEIDTNDMPCVSIDSRWRNTPCKFDVKGSAGSALWLLVEDYKFSANVYILVNLDLPRIPDLRKQMSNFEMRDVGFKIEGYATPGDFERTGRKIFEFKKNDQLFRVPPYLRDASLEQIREHRRNLRESDYFGPHLDATLNYGLPKAWLRNSDED